jgi:uncharacterized membrane protein YoaK (UPF0700 family)
MKKKIALAVVLFVVGAVAAAALQSRASQPEAEQAK